MTSDIDALRAHYAENAEHNLAVHAEAKRRGRPKGSRDSKPRGHGRTARLIVRCSPEEHARWEAEAKAEGVKLAAWVRARLG